MRNNSGLERATEIAARVEAFVREVVIPYERDPRLGAHGPSDELVQEMREKARAAKVLTPHILADGRHLSQLETALVLRKSGLSILGPLACNTMAPDEGNMYLLGKIGNAMIRERFLQPLVEGRARSAFFMTEPAETGGAGRPVDDADDLSPGGQALGCQWPQGVHHRGRRGQGRHRHGEVRRWRLHVCRRFAGPCGYHRARARYHGQFHARRHAIVAIDNLRVPAEQMLGQSGEGFKYAQVRLSPARLSHCMRWLGACLRAHEIATAYACRREAFGKKLVDHEGVGFMLADNLIDLKQAELMIDWCATVLDGGSLGTTESSMTKVAVSEALMRVADRSVQVMGGAGVSGDTMVEQVFREVRAFRIYDGPTEVHKWSLAKKVKRDHVKAHGV